MSKSGWTMCWDHKLHHFSSIDDASECGKQFIAPPITLRYYTKEDLEFTDTCERCLQVYEKEKGAEADD